MADKARITRINDAASSAQRQSVKSTLKQGSEKRDSKERKRSSMVC